MGFGQFGFHFSAGLALRNHFNRGCEVRVAAYCSGYSCVQTLTGFAVGDQVASGLGFGQFGFHFSAGLAHAATVAWGYRCG